METFSLYVNTDMEHFFSSINVEGWFTYPYLYKKMVNYAPENAHFVEVGSWKGASAACMAVEIINSGKKIKFDCVDTWRGSDEHSLNSIDQQEELYLTFLKNTEPVRNYITAYRTFSTKAAVLYKDESLDFVFIDAAHDYENVLADIKAWYPKVKRGGIIAGHDYNPDSDTEGWVGVKKAVHEFFKTNEIQASRGELCWLHLKK